MSQYLMGEYDIVIVGAGHAGCEAGLASARMGKKTLLLSINLEAVAMMACNPSIGGTGKGHLVREIDALGGQMGLNIDKTFIQSRMLNTAKGPAVHSLRAQADKNRYHLEMKKTLEEEPLLDLALSLGLPGPEPSFKFLYGRRCDENGECVRIYLLDILRSLDFYDEDNDLSVCHLLFDLALERSVIVVAVERMLKKITL